MKEKTGKRQRLRDQFMNGNEGSRTDAALLDLILTYAVAQQEVQPLRDRLLARFGDLEAVLEADLPSLREVDGLKAEAATLLKAIQLIRSRRSGTAKTPAPAPAPGASVQPGLFDLVSADAEDRDARPGCAAPIEAAEPPSSSQSQDDDFTSPAEVNREVSVSAAPRQEGDSSRLNVRRGAMLFGQAVLEETIQLLPRMLDVQSTDEIRACLMESLHFSGEDTRYRRTNAILRRFFPDGFSNPALRLFAHCFAGKQELRDVCFYQFCRAEPLLPQVIEELLLPRMESGALERGRLRQYLVQQFPAAKKNTVDATNTGVVNALVAGGMARADRNVLTFAYRRILLPSFAFIVHSEFPEPGLHDLRALEESWALRAMLWNPEQVLPSLYELRNQGILGRVSEIDTVRQFSTRWSLDELVARLADPGVGL